MCQSRRVIARGGSKTPPTADGCINLNPNMAAVFDDVTSSFFAAAAGMHTGQMLHGTNFNLWDASTWQRVGQVCDCLLPLSTDRSVCFCIVVCARVDSACC